MLNIEDVRKKLQRNPEPVEVKEIREHIINTFNKLEFIEESHQYFLPQEDGTKRELLSVSVTCHQFEPDVDWDMIAAKKALKLGIPVEQLKRQWFENNHQATNMGTGVHLYGENLMYMVLDQEDKICDVIKPQYEAGYLFPHSQREKAALKYYEDLFLIDEIYPVMPETRVYMGINDKFPVNNPFAGTFDILHAMKVKGQWKLLLHDFKTNADLYKDYARDHHIMLKAPFDYLYDEPVSIYTLQLSCYEMALRQIGYDVIDRRLIWLKDDGTYEKIAVPSVVDTLAKIL